MKPPWGQKKLSLSFLSVHVTLVKHTTNYTLAPLKNLAFDIFVAVVFGWWSWRGRLGGVRCLAMPLKWHSWEIAWAKQFWRQIRLQERAREYNPRKSCSLVNPRPWASPLLPSRDQCQTSIHSHWTHKRMSHLKPISKSIQFESRFVYDFLLFSPWGLPPAPNPFLLLPSPP